MPRFKARLASFVSFPDYGLFSFSTEELGHIYIEVTNQQCQVVSDLLAAHCLDEADAGQRPASRELEAIPKQ